MEYRLLIAGIYFEIAAPFSFIMTRESKAFISACDDCTDVHLNFCTVKTIPLKEESPIFHQHIKYYYPDGLVYLQKVFDKKPFAYITKADQNYTVTCNYLKGFEEELFYSRRIFAVFGLESILLDFNTIIMHASYIIYNDYAILFSGTSGIGKSTQADLWKEYLGADIINGDRAALKKESGQWYAYGLPIAGSSEIYVNQKAPIKALILLKQDSENSVRAVPAEYAYRYLYPQVMMHRWAADFEEKASSILVELIQSVPVYFLACRPDREAVSCLHNSLFKE